MMAILAMEPRLIILDEPFTGLDIPTKMQLTRYFHATMPWMTQITSPRPFACAADSTTWRASDMEKKRSPHRSFCGAHRRLGAHPENHPSLWRPDHRTEPRCVAVRHSSRLKTRRAFGAFIFAPGGDRAATPFGWQGRAWPLCLSNGGLSGWPIAAFVTGLIIEKWRSLNNRAEYSHLPFRRRERAMLRFRRLRSLQKFASVHASVLNLFNSERGFYSRINFRVNRSAALAGWRSLCSDQRAVQLSKLRRVRTRLTAVRRVLCRLAAPRMVS